MGEVVGAGAKRSGATRGKREAFFRCADVDCENGLTMARFAKRPWGLERCVPTVCVLVQEGLDGGHFPWIAAA